MTTTLSDWPGGQLGNGMNIKPSIDDNDAREQHMAAKIKRHAENYKGSLLVGFSVQLLLPPGASHGDARRYVKAALDMHAGSLEPGEDPFFDLNRDFVTVLTIEPPGAREAEQRAVARDAADNARAVAFGWSIVACVVCAVAGFGAGVWFVNSLY